MNILDLLELNYKAFVSLKKHEPELANVLTEQQQDMVMTQDTDNPGYMLWRIARAVSVAHCFEVYERLNVPGLCDLDTVRGETFYAGVPPVTKQELALGKLLLNTTLAGLFDTAEGVSLDGIMIDNDGVYRYYDRERDVWGEPVSGLEVYNA
ncbi:hypothetical protein [Neptuniibacter sp.]|uniref:hypothetical protein n=1 Tax=Neptuniibacter sp. TaxID=1962643 RepID=UPI00260CC1AC|nr:hypothetical protein [Neptuniibacter sp.]MCP4596243.1 hypothetical protein [Neptuniibacter sp.]